MKLFFVLCVMTMCHAAFPTANFQPFGAPQSLADMRSMYWDANGGTPRLFCGGGFANFLANYDPVGDTTVVSADANVDASVTAITMTTVPSVRLWVGGDMTTSKLRYFATANINALASSVAYSATAIGGPVKALAATEDGASVYVGGSFNTPFPNVFEARYNAMMGTYTATAMSAGLTGDVNTIWVDVNRNRVYAGGLFAGGIAYFELDAMTGWTSLGLNPQVYSLAAGPAPATLYAGGYFPAQTSSVIEINLNTNAVSTLNSGMGTSLVNGIAATSTREAIVVGEFSTVIHPYVAGYDRISTTWESFGTFASNGYCVVRSPDRLFVGGAFGGEVTPFPISSTNVPTASPTVPATTSDPTTMPTATPSTAPTTAPTGAPTTAPTASPTAALTSNPTSSPTLAPTAAPTTSPTTAPTNAPTVAPTLSPTATPTVAPTVAPTMTPTVSPTPAPIEQSVAIFPDANFDNCDTGVGCSFDLNPIGETQNIQKVTVGVVVQTGRRRDVEIRIQSPSGTVRTLCASTGGNSQNWNVRFDSTGTITIATYTNFGSVPLTPPYRDVVQPANDLNAYNLQDAKGVWKLWVKAVNGAAFNGRRLKQVNVVTIGPMRTATPTVTPTRAPTSDAPTASFSPTVTPTVAPSKAPTTSPTAAPTVAPTTAPTVAAGQPSKAPTTRNPTSLSPTTTPTTSPTAAPTVTPTVAPSKTPTTAPSKTPTVRPTRLPTNSPTLAPTWGPTTGRPTKAPSGTPTMTPTVRPTKSPSKTPTAAPTKAPSKTPTEAPSPSPTKQPTFRPTGSPTKKPTKQPSKSPTPAPEGEIACFSTGECQCGSATLCRCEGSTTDCKCQNSKTCRCISVSGTCFGGNAEIVSFEEGIKVECQNAQICLNRTEVSGAIGHQSCAFALFLAAILVALL